MHNTNFEPQDICKWDKDIDVDLVMHGSPCQDFSIVGQQAGGDEGSGTRSSLMYETLRIVGKLKPTYVIWENVKNIISKKHIHNFNNYIERMNELGYTSYYQVLNAKDYGIPQNRERVFAISIRNDIGLDFKFPKKCLSEKCLLDFLEKDVSDDYSLSEHFLKQIKNTKYKKDFYIDNTNKLLDGYFNTFKVMDYRYDEGLRIRKNNLCPTLTTRGKQSISGVPIIYNNKTLRFITEKECWRLMGFDDNDFRKVKKTGITDTQLYKQAGNSIVVNVLEAILNNLLIDYKKDKFSDLD